MKPRYAAGSAGLVFVTVVAFVVFLESGDADTQKAVWEIQPAASPVPTPMIAVPPTPVLVEPIRAIVATIEAGDADGLVAALRRYYICSQVIDEVPRCPPGSGPEVVAQIGLHIYPAYRPPGLMQTWLDAFMAGNDFRLVLLAHAPASDYRPDDGLLLVFEAREPRSVSFGGRQLDGLAISVIRASSVIAELDFYCVRRTDCGRSFSEDAEQFERLARGKVDPEYCDLSYGVICIELRRNFTSR